MEQNEVLTAARNMLKERTDSLKNDVKRCCLDTCEDSQFAPFPALLYCFSTIDLLGALYGGNAEGDSPKQSRNYMVDIMRYPMEKVFLMQEIFRHKIVHLAQPEPKITIDSSIIDNKLKGKAYDGLKAYLKKRIEFGLYSWGIEHRDRAKHLTIESLGKEGQDDRFRFWVTIWSLVEDIVDSVYKPNGYLHRLEKNEDDLQRKFETAVKQIFEVLGEW